MECTEDAVKLILSLEAKLASEKDRECRKSDNLKMLKELQALWREVKVIELDRTEHLQNMKTWISINNSKGHFDVGVASLKMSKKNLNL